MSIVRTSLLSLMLSVPVSCTRTSPPVAPAAVSPEQAAVAQAALAFIRTHRWMSPSHKSSIPVARAGTREYAVLASVDSVVALESLRSTRDVLFPAGHMRLDSIRVDGDSARFFAVFGPIPRPRRGFMLGCGQHLRLSLGRDASGTWVVDPQYVVKVC